MMERRYDTMALGRYSLLAACAVVGTASLCAQTGRFDLLGPKVDVHVTRGDQSLPIASVPNLQAGDKLQVHADFPSTQSVHFLLVIAFLRGTTNPPPDSWFTRIETWKRNVRDEGITIVVPDEAQQAVMFIAPETGGDFSTLKSAVRGRPGTFVRASQDLNEASFEQSRIERYVQAIRQVPPGSPAELLDHSHKLAATLQLKPDDECFKRPVDLQASCLSQSGSALLLDDGHGQTMAQMLSTGPSSDLIGAVAGTPMATAAGIGMYSAYVGTVLDVVRLLTGLHTAKYQYIPAIAFPDGNALNLRLNTAPSFHNPKSVIVIALPAIEKAVPPPLQSQDGNHVSCLLQPRVVLPLNGAPLVFATGFAHDLTLHLDQPGPDGRTDLPLMPDAYEGGLIVNEEMQRKPLGMVAPEVRPDPSTSAAKPQDVRAPSPALAGPASYPSKAGSSVSTSSLSGPVQSTGVVRGKWGFDAFEGPTIKVQRRPGENWTVSSTGELFTGRSNTITLRSTGTACVATVSLGSGSSAPKLDWHLQDAGSEQVVVAKLPLEKASPGGLAVLVHQFDGAGTSNAVQTVPVRAYVDVLRAEELIAHAGDRSVLLRGTGLEGVASAVLDGITLVPSDDAPGDPKTLRLQSATGGKFPVLKAGDSGSAQITLRDGRKVAVPFHVEGPRPSVTLLTSSFQQGESAGLPVVLTEAHAMPLNGKLTFSIRSEAPTKFPRSEKIEVALADESLSTVLSLADRTLVLQDARTVIGTVSPGSVFGPSAFGPLQLRVLAADGTTSDWLSLGSLVRTPVVQSVTCSTRPNAGMRQTQTASSTPTPAQSAQSVAEEVTSLPCMLQGSDLFLIQGVAAAPSDLPTSVPEGYAAGSLPVPRPADGRTLYLQLRDDPAALAAVTVDAGKPSRK